MTDGLFYRRSNIKEGSGNNVHMNKANVNSFLLMGYFLDFRNPAISFDFSGIDKSFYADVPYEELLPRAAALYREAVSSQFRSGTLNFLPLSGGLDSRAILALLLEHTEAANIHTYTFGTPGTMDYDIGCRLAKRIGTDHTAMDLSNYQYTMDELLATSARMQRQIMLFTHPPLFDWDERYEGGVLWSGYVGGRTSGSYLSAHPSRDLEEAKRRYIQHNLLAKTLPVSEEMMQGIIALIDWDGGNEEITIDERLDLINRQVKYTYINNVMDGFDCRLPFAYPPLFTFLFSLPDKYRADQRLYIDVFLRYFKDVFNFSSKTTIGLPVNTPPALTRLKTRFINIRKHIPGLHLLIKDPFCNYFNFEKRIRRDPQFQRLIRTSLDDLKRRQLIDWIDIDRLWTQHMNRGVDHSQALLTLASLEIHLKAGKKL